MVLGVRRKADTVELPTFFVFIVSSQELLIQYHTI